MARNVYRDFTTNDPIDCPHCGEKMVAASYYRKHIKTHKCIETKKLRKLKADGFAPLHWGMHNACEAAGIECRLAAAQPGRPRSGTTRYAPEWVNWFGSAKERLSASHASAWMALFKQCHEDAEALAAVTAAVALNGAPALLEFISQGAGRCTELRGCRDKQMVKLARKVRRRYRGSTVADRADEVGLEQCQVGRSTPTWW